MLNSLITQIKSCNDDAMAKSPINTVRGLGSE